MKFLGLLLVAGLLTGCASVDARDPNASDQSQPVEVAAESPSEVPEKPANELDGEEADASMVEPETEPEESASATTQSVKPSATKAPPASQKAEPVDPQTPKQTQEPAPSPEPEPEPVESKYSMANIAKNDSTSSCWAAISGKAYNLTDWISKHPGGAGAIVSICGTDATSVFQGRHGGQSGPASSLSSYLLGDIDS
jgi:cytochrome b involved in lipid metabolism